MRDLTGAVDIFWEDDRDNSADNVISEDNSLID